MKTEQEPIERKESIVRLTLYPSQAKQFQPLLEDAFDRTGIHGILCTVNRIQDLSEGHLFLELQAARLARWGGDPQNPATDFRQPSGAEAGNAPAHHPGSDQRRSVDRAFGNKEDHRKEAFIGFVKPTVTENLQSNTDWCRDQKRNNA